LSVANPFSRLARIAILIQILSCWFLSYQTTSGGGVYPSEPPAMAGRTNGRPHEDANGDAIMSTSELNAQPSATVNQVSRLKIWCLLN